MIRYEDWCVGCPKEMGCLGDSCRYKNVPVYECDECKNEVDKLYVYEGKQLCWDCFRNQFEEVDDDTYLVDDERVYVDDLEDYCEEVIE